MNNDKNTAELQINSQWNDGRLRLVEWTPQSKIIIKRAYLSLRDTLNSKISGFCMHVKGRGGVKAAARCIYSQLQKYGFAARFDIKSYYSSMDHDVLIGILENHELDDSILNIVKQYLKVPDRNNTGVGIVAGGALSPFLGAVYLGPLDAAMKKLFLRGKIFYIRYQDDFVILAKSRWELKRSIKLMYSIISELKLQVHTEEKCFIGKIDKGFSFLGYFFKPNCKLRPSRESLERLKSKSLRLYEQACKNRLENFDTLRFRLRQYLERWLLYLKSGLQGIIKKYTVKKLEKFIEFNFKKNNIIL